ncbi:MAG: site-specific DNA-methyltransferase [Acidobacteriales bacterium]|nr:site-specific DNA-methyltransferase [Terriglobales bacterium]
MERFLGMPLDTKAVPQANLNIANKERSNLFPWNGQFSPQLVEALLTSFARDAATVLDPFVGSGTVIREAARLGKEAFGTEINPAACKMAQTYGLMRLPERERRGVVEWIDDHLADALPDQISLFSQANSRVAVDVKEAVLTMHQQAQGEWERIVTEALVILLDFYDECTTEKVNRTWRRLRSTVTEFENAVRPIHVFSADARKIPIPDASIDFLVTSPPYINVFNYHQKYRRSAEAIGWNLLEVAKAEIGSNRKHRGNRFLTVVQYCLDMTQALQEMARVCREGARLVLVVGRESNVRKTPFFNGDMLANIAVRSLGWSFLLRQERKFMNRFGDTIWEDILHFSPRRIQQNGPQGVQPREIAREALTEAMGRVAGEAKADLEEALSLIAEIRSSPLFDPTAALSRETTRK